LRVSLFGCLGVAAVGTNNGSCPGALGLPCRLKQAPCIYRDPGGDCWRGRVC
jgi:hypothetical protein